LPPRNRMSPSAAAAAGLPRSKFQIELPAIASAGSSVTKV
jgi:hypothetical protein